jgi:hypothetical protein
MFGNLIGSVLEVFLLECILIYIWITKGRFFIKMAIYP